MAILNRRARHEYHILENYEVGMMLLGPEVKSIRSGLANLAEAHCIIRNERLYLIG
ncbi:MAG: SsrA-binding protein, partial [Mariprofundaceae bacterium]